MSPWQPHASSSQSYIDRGWFLQGCLAAEDLERWWCHTKADITSICRFPVVQEVFNNSGPRFSIVLQHLAQIGLDKENQVLIFKNVTVLW